MPTCPRGHLSGTSDYCDDCGAPIDAGGADSDDTATHSSTSPRPAAGRSPEPVVEVCPVCATPGTAGDRFCEGCGADRATPTERRGPEPWFAIATADRAYFDRGGPDGIAFPDECPERVFRLDAGDAAIGRRSLSRGVEPDIDLSVPVEDPGVSHRHAVLARSPDGDFAVIDVGSTNGTTINDDTTPIPAGIPVTLADGDRIHLGAWTTITMHASPRPA